MHYIEQGRSGTAGKRRPLFDRMRKDAALRKFERVLVWKVTRLGRDMRDVITTVYELADLYHDRPAEVPDRAREHGHWPPAMGHPSMVRGKWRTKSAART